MFTWESWNSLVHNDNDDTDQTVNDDVGMYSVGGGGGQDKNYNCFDHCW